jgi:hypothetical protein
MGSAQMGVLIDEARHLTPEKRIHAGVLVALAALAVGVFSLVPLLDTTRDGARANVVLTEPPRELEPAQIDAAIGSLEAWIAEARPRTESLAAADPNALAPRPSAADRANPGRWLERTLGSREAALGRGRTDATGAGDIARARALTLLIEAGVPLEQTLTQGVEPGETSTSLRDAVRQVLDELPSRPSTAPDPWLLDLLSFAVLDGLAEYRTPLSSFMAATLLELERRQRQAPIRPGDGEIDRVRLDELAREWRASGAGERAEWYWHASAALFRAATVLDDPAFTLPIRRQLGELFFRYLSDRALYAHLACTARSAEERRRVQLSALENWGSMEDALYSARLGAARDEPGQSRTTLVMRQAARDLLDDWQALAAGDTLATQKGATRAALLHAAQDALRGLRCARTAG